MMGKKGNVLLLCLCLLFGLIKQSLAVQEVKPLGTDSAISLPADLVKQDYPQPTKPLFPPVPPSPLPKPPEELLIKKLPEESTPQVVSKKGIKQFGLDIFQGAPSVFEPVTEAPVGPDYIIGPGDNIIIELWGKFEAVHNLVVDKGGKMFIPKVGVVHVWGISFSQLEKLLREKFSIVFTDFQMNVTMGKLRAIKVFVVGEALRPGSYFVSSLSTVFNALYVAGGPTDKGSLRKIKLIRNKKVVDEIDFYNFLLEGDKSQDHRLQSGDTVFIPLRGPLAGIGGGIKRPAFYELKDKTKLTEFIEMAGGVTPEGYLQRIQVERIEEHEKRVVADVELSDLYENKAQDVSLKDSDFVMIFPILKEMYQYVDLTGAVLRPGRYELKENMTILELLNKGTVLEEAYLKRADILRTFKDKQQEVIPINLAELLKGDKAQNLKLQQWDRVIVYSQWEVAPKPVVSITGLVKTPGSYTLFQNMQVSDLVFQAGGVTKEIDLLKAEVIRVLENEEIEVIPVDVASLLKEENASDLKLQPYDRVAVFSVWEPQLVPVVRVMGLVRNPGTYELTEGMKVSDLIVRAGSLRKEATFLNAELCRMTKSPYGVSFDHIPLNLGEVIGKEATRDIPLQEDDLLFVRQVPKWHLQSTVTLSGEIAFPGVYAIKKEEKLSSVLKRAGGFTEEAFLKGTVFVRKSVAKSQAEEINKRFLLLQEEVLLKEETKLLEAGLSSEKAEERKVALAKKRELLGIAVAKIPKGRVVIKLDELDKFANTKDDFVLEDGDSLFIPEVPISVTVIGEVYNPAAIFYHKGEGVKYYVQTAGGITRNADKKEIYLVKADGKVAKKGLFGFKGRGIERGDVIVVPPRMAPKLSWKDIIEPLYQFAATIAVIANILK